MTAVFSGLACVLAAMAMATVDDPSAGRDAGWRTLVAALVVFVSASYLILHLAVG
jgi:hypothetical protein